MKWGRHFGSVRKSLELSDGVQIFVREVEVYPSAESLYGRNASLAEIPSSVQVHCLGGRTLRDAKAHLVWRPKLSATTVGLRDRRVARFVARFTA